MLSQLCAACLRSLVVPSRLALAVICSFRSFLAYGVVTAKWFVETSVLPSCCWSLLPHNHTWQHFGPSCCPPGDIVSLPPNSSRILRLPSQASRVSFLRTKSPCPPNIRCTTRLQHSPSRPRRSAALLFSRADKKKRSAEDDQEITQRNRQLELPSTESRADNNRAEERQSTKGISTRDPRRVARHSNNQHP